MSQCLVLGLTLFPLLFSHLDTCSHRYFYLHSIIFICFNFCFFFLDIDKLISLRFKSRSLLYPVFDERLGLNVSCPSFSLQIISIYVPTGWYFCIDILIHLGQLAFIGDGILGFFFNCASTTFLKHELTLDISLGLWLKHEVRISLTNR